MKVNINNISIRLQKYLKIKKTNLRFGFDVESKHEPSLFKLHFLTCSAFQVY